MTDDGARAAPPVLRLHSRTGCLSSTQLDQTFRLAFRTLTAMLATAWNHLRKARLTDSVIPLSRTSRTSRPISDSTCVGLTILGTRACLSCCAFARRSRLRGRLMTSVFLVAGPSPIDGKTCRYAYVGTPVLHSTVDHGESAVHPGFVSPSATTVNAVTGSARTVAALHG